MENAQKPVDRVALCENFIHSVKGQEVRTMFDNLKKSDSGLWSDMRTAIMQLISKGNRTDLETEFPEYALCSGRPFPSKPIVAPSDSIIIVECVSCSGILLCSVEKFLSGADQKAIDKYERAGHKAIKKPLDWNTDKDSCRCSKDSVYNVVARRSQVVHKPTVTFRR
jgi:hypothetical protein